jgi:hypothetical protein
MIVSRPWTAANGAVAYHWRILLSPQFLAFGHYEHITYHRLNASCAPYSLQILQIAVEPYPGCC